MARADSIGMFWADEPKAKAEKKEKVKPTPPVKFWVHPDYLPGLAEALAYKPDLYTDQELINTAANKEQLIFDSEIYPNYCLFAFKGVDSGKVVRIRMFGYLEEKDLSKLGWIMENFTIVNFNGRAFDIPITSLALNKLSTEDLWQATVMLIQQGMRPHEVLKIYKTKLIKVDQIDLIELTALGPSLKKCAGRLHAKRMQDLPFVPGSILSDNQIVIIDYYCVNDLDNTLLLRNSVLEQIKLREQMSLRYKVDLRSLSDAQMAEAIVSSEIRRISGRKYLERTTIDPGTCYKYKVPKFVSFTTPMMNSIVEIIRNAEFEVGEGGSIVMPQEISGRVIEIAKGKYKIGIGGLHSQEKSIAHVANDEYFIADTDATSYYPRLILNAGLTPKNLGKDFLMIYDSVITERVKAKRAGDTVVANCLKIVGNGSFGKLGSMWSIMYAPNLLLQVTITGQLSILMLVERFELAGIEVISVNTDGIVVKCLRSKEEVFNGIVKQWEKETGFGTEEVRYKAVYSKDINNYFAIYEVPEKGKHFKTKGLYAPTSSSKNAVNEICVEAVKELILNGTPLLTTLLGCKEIRKFTTMRDIRGGVVSKDQYLGKVARWYYATGDHEFLIVANSGYKVPKTDGAKALMELPDVFPNDVNYEWYLQECYGMLEDIGYSPKTVKEKGKK